MQHGHSSSYPSEGRGGSSKRSGRERNESNGNNPATWDALQETCTLRWKDARYDRDRLIALRIALQPTGSHELFDTELKRRGDELIEMHTFMASTYGPNRVKSTGSQPKVLPSLVTTKDTSRLKHEGPWFQLYKDLTANERERTDLLAQFIQETREGKTAGYLFELRSLRQTESYRSNPEFVSDWKSLMKRKNLINREVGNHMDTITAASLISFQNGKPDRETAETLGTRDRKTAHWLDDLAKLRAMEANRLDQLGANQDMEEGEIWERSVPPHILAEAAQSKDDLSRGCYGNQSDGSDIEYAW